MKLVVGLGNPGKEYQNSRHNIGFSVLDAFLMYLQTQDVLIQNDGWQQSKGAHAEYMWFEAEGESIELLKPQSFMNKSGAVVWHAVEKHTELIPSDILVIHDEMAFAVGEYKFSFRKEANSHNGVQSIIDVLGTSDFWRLRVGVGGANKGERRQDAADYILSSPTYWETKKLKHLTSTELPQQIYRWVTGKIN